MRELDLDRELREFLDQVMLRKRAPRASSCRWRGDDDAVNASQFGGGHVQAINFAVAAFKIQPSAQCIQNRPWLLVNFLEHEVRMFAASDIFVAEFQIADLDVGCVGAEIGNLEAFRRDGHDVVIVQVNHFFRVRDDGVRVAGEKIFLLADADDERRTASRADNCVRQIRADDRETVGADDYIQRVRDGQGQKCRWWSASLRARRLLSCLGRVMRAERHASPFNFS